MKLKAAGLTAFFLSVTVFAAFAAEDDRSKLAGTWELQGGSETWVLQPNGDSWHIAYKQGNQKPAEFDCVADGHDCAVKEAGHAAKISLWFSGPKLVELETKGTEVIKRRFAIAEQADQMDVEIIPVVSTAKPETLHFKRASIAASK